MWLESNWRKLNEYIVAEPDINRLIWFGTGFYHSLAILAITKG